MKNLVLLRQSTGKTQKEIANEIGITDKAYWSYENNRTQPDFDTLIKIADYFDVSLDYLLERPRPYDLPSYATEEQKQLIQLILKLSQLNVIKAISYCAGLLASQS